MGLLPHPVHLCRVDSAWINTIHQGVWREGVETSGIERVRLDARTWVLARKIRAEVSLKNKMADGSCGLNFSNYNNYKKGLVFDNTDEFGDSVDAQEDIAEITKTSNLAKCSMNNLKQCNQRAAICSRIRVFFNENLS